MSRTSELLTLLLAGCLLAGCASTVPYHQLTRWEKQQDGAGGFKAYHFRDYGSFAAGEFSSGSSELIFDGLYYLEVRDGKASSCTSTESLSGGWAVRFRADRIDALPANTTETSGAKHVDDLVPDMSMACAFRITGRFTGLSIRGAAGRVVRRNDLVGSIYGYRAPALDGKTRREMWFLSGDRTCGGRVESFTLADGSIAIDLCPNNLMIHTAGARASRQLRK